MKLLLIILLFSSNARAQTFTRNDIGVMSAQMLAGYATGWREQVLYHPNELFKQYPNLNRKFWDSRQPSRWNANHWLKTASVTFHTVGIVIKIGEKPKNWKLYALDFAKYYGAYKTGFFLAYNVTHKNKLTW